MIDIVDRLRHMPDPFGHGRTIHTEAADEIERLTRERDAAFQALTNMRRYFERMQRALAVMVDTCGEHIEDVLSYEDAPEFFQAINDARSALEETAI